MAADRVSSSSMLRLASMSVHAWCAPCHGAPAKLHDQPAPAKETTRKYNSGNHEIAIIRHWKIAAEAGDQPPLNVLRDIYNGNMPGKKFISKDFLESTYYRACHEAQMEVKSEEREKHSGVLG